MSDSAELELDTTNWAFQQNQNNKLKMVTLVSLDSIWNGVHKST